MKKIITTTILILAIAALSGCDFEFSSASISDIKMCNQLDGDLCGENTTIFHPNATNIVASCKLKYAPPETQITFTWIYTENPEEIIIDAVTLNTYDKGSNLDLHTSLSRPNNGWPKGSYKVEIKIGEIENSLKTIEFEVQ